MKIEKLRYAKYPDEEYQFNGLCMLFIVADFPYWRQPEEDNIELIEIFENVDGDFDVTEEEAMYSVILNFCAS